ncbi:hypothetical protein [Aldersonia kunmingensis]|uniref:hypothetical protein n=1 Tax=Aldersonia kunmingensis TaxID=408066 RepID=UPI000AECD65B|nr:hypothetical protein [Aldersonia kunmingensis]
MPQYATPTAEPADAGVVYWPQPSPLDDWWTEIMDGATPARARDTVPGQHLHNSPTSPTHRSPT